MHPPFYSSDEFGMPLRLVTLLASALAVLGVAVALFVVAPRYGGRLGVMGDAHYVYVAGVSLAEDYDYDIRDELKELGDPWRFGSDPSGDGIQLPVRELGPSLLMVPGIMFARATDQPRELWPVFATLPAALSWSLTFLGLCSALAAFATTTSSGARVWIAFTTTLAMPGAFYAVGYSGYAHGPDAAICAWVVAVLVRRSSPLLIGGVLAIALLFRLQNALWLVWPAWMVFSSAPKERVKAIHRTIAIASVAGLGVVPQMIMGLRHPDAGRGAIRWTADFFDVMHPISDLVEVLTGVHGLLTWTPIAVLGVLGLVVAATQHRADRGVAVSALLVTTGLVLLCAAARDPAAGHAFGARRLAGLVPVIALGVCVLRSRSSGPAVRLLDVAIGLLALANMVVMFLVVRGEVLLAP